MTIDEKLDILKNEYLPIMVDQIADKVLEQSRAVEVMRTYLNTGVMVNHINIRSYFKFNSFDEYLLYRKQVKL